MCLFARNYLKIRIVNANAIRVCSEEVVYYTMECYFIFVWFNVFAWQQVSAQNI